MNIIRRLSLLAIGALLVLGVVASAASATTIHSGSTTGPVYSGSVSSTLSAATTSDFTSGFVNISCDTSSIIGDVSVSGTNVANINSASWTDTSTGGAGCPNNIGGTSTSTAKFTPFLGNPPCTTSSANWKGGSVTFVGSPGRDGDLTIGCVDVSIVSTDVFGSATTCEYRGSGTNASVTGSLNNSAGTVTFTNAGLTKVSGPFTCSGTATYTGKYDVRGSGGVQLYVTA